ncbi:helix-turn-helix domain-containing protein [Blautia sp. RD014234]|nr:helix-turn-helix domain-containing protein [Blautia parvula]
MFYQERQINLTAKEYSLLELLVQNRGQILTKETILERIWDIDGQFVVENTVSVTVNRLRKKIEPDNAHPIFVKNVFGLGYTFGD